MYTSESRCARFRSYIQFLRISDKILSKVRRKTHTKRQTHRHRHTQTDTNSETHSLTLTNRYTLAHTLTDRQNQRHTHALNQLLYIP